MLNHTSSEPNIYDTQHPLPNRDCLKLFHLWIWALKQIKIFDHKGLTNLTGASQDPIARGYSYIVKTENYSAFKCCFQEVRIIKHRTHSPKEAVGLILPGSCSGKPFYNVPIHSEKNFLLCPEPHFLGSFPYSALGRKEMLPLPQSAWNSCDPVWWHQPGPKILPTETCSAPEPSPMDTPALCCTSGAAPDF